MEGCQFKEAREHNEKIKQFLRTQNDDQNILAVCCDSKGGFLLK